MTGEKKPRPTKVRGFSLRPHPPGGGHDSSRSDLLGGRSCAGSGGSSRVSSCLGRICSSRSSVSSSGGGSGSVRSGSFCGWCRCSGWCFHWSGSWYWSGFFLLATSGECSSSDQGGQNERVLHLDVPSWTNRILKSHRARLLEKPLYALARCTWIAPFWRNSGLYWHLVNTD